VEQSRNDAAAAGAKGAPGDGVFRSLPGLPARVGQLLLAPRVGLERIEREGGGLRDTLWLVAVGTIAFRFPRLLEALLGLRDLSLDAVLRVASVAASEIQAAAWIVLPAAVVVTALAGARRDSSRDLELGAACYVPYFAVRALGRALEAVKGTDSLDALTAQVPAALVALVVLGRAVLVARSRASDDRARAAGDAASGSPPGPRAASLVAGLVVAAVAVVGLVGNAVWSSRNFAALQSVTHGEPAPGFSLARADGQAGSISLSSLRGQVVVLDFWATYCAPCRIMMPTLDELHGQWGAKGVAFVGIDSENISAESLQSFLGGHPIPYPVVSDDGEASASYHVESIPSLFVIGKDGTIRDSFVGVTAKSTLERALARAAAR